MKIPMQQFQERLLAFYAADNAKYTSLALWKMQTMTSEGEAFYLPENDCYYVLRDKQLLFYTSADNQCHIPIEELNKLDLIVLQPEILDTAKEGLDGFNISYSWALFYDFDYQPKQDSPAQYEAVDFDFADEQHYQIAADIINSDAGGGFHPERLKRWTKFPSFDPSLWIFIRDAATQKYASIGISTYHKGVQETDLDWIYVLPEYQGKRVGSFLIREIIRRAAPRSKVIRVGGVEAFYKKCGFYEKQRWGVAIRPGFSLNEQ